MASDVRISVDTSAIEGTLALALGRLDEINTRLEVLMASGDELRQQFAGLRGDVLAKLDAVDNRIEELRAQVAQGQVDQAALDALSAEIAEARAAVQAVNPDDPSGDDPAPA